ncbi:MAG TPA: endonuclease V [Candidatus Obscuribacterales bacterium]
MKARFTLPDVSAFAEAAEIQERLASEVRLEPNARVAKIAGVDASYRSGRTWGAAVLMDTFGKVIETAVTGPLEVEFPYVPGFLSWRECPAAARALEMLTNDADCILVDGHGLLHPRLCGLACVIGLMFDRCTVGCAKTPWRSEWSEPGEQRGDWSPVFLDGRLLGATVRTRTGVAPVWVSPGHKCDVEGAVNIVLEVSRTRIPEPLRLAHLAAKAASSR